MFNCEDCSNKDNCKAKSLAIAMQNEVSTIKKKYGGFFGRIIIDCDFNAKGGQYE